jgi:hypothetical protein
VKVAAFTRACGRRRGLSTAWRSDKKQLSARRKTINALK